MLTLTSTLQGTDSVQLAGLRAASVSSIPELEKLLAASIHNRSTASTNCNLHSSRSHFVFRLLVRSLLMLGSGLRIGV